MLASEVVIGALWDLLAHERGLRIVWQTQKTEESRKALNLCWDTDHAISELVAVGREHHARERFGDARVDQWFRDNGINPDAVRGTEYRPSPPERSKSGGPYGRKAHAERRAARLRASVAEVGLLEAQRAG